MALPRIDRVRFLTASLGALLLAAVAMALVGCQTARFYGQAIRGQCQMIHRQQPISRLLAQTNTSPELAVRLRLVLRLRAFAERELGLPANGHYLTYADLGRRFAVWNVYAAPEFSLEARSWWYPVVGRLKYQGYFQEPSARRLAARLEARGDDVYVGGVQAYSTLGWFRDPVLNTFIFDPEADLADLLFHELTHQRVFVPGDTDYNEALATAVAEEGVRRWLRAEGRLPELKRYEEEARRKEAFVALLSGTRERLEVLYQGTAGNSAQDPVSLRAAKARIFEDLRAGHDALRESWGGHSDYEPWFRLPLNNARLNTVETYHRWVPAFRRLLDRLDGRLDRFLTEMDRLATLPEETRREHLEALRAEAAGARGHPSGPEATRGPGR